jgi:hypothetical protein
MDSCPIFIGQLFLGLPVPIDAIALPVTRRLCKRIRATPDRLEALVLLVLRSSSGHWYKGATAISARCSQRSDAGLRGGACQELTI